MGLKLNEYYRYKNYREVFNTRRTEIKKAEGGKYTLIIKNVTEEDIGSIECHARNFYGSVSTRANLDVNGKNFIILDTF